MGLIFLVQVYLFSRGYRLSADDADVLRGFMGGEYPDVWQGAAMAAPSQGRIGMHLMLPLNAYASYLSIYPVARWIFACLYLVVFVLFATYVARLSRGVGGAPLVLLLLALHPLAFEHMPPNAYALQNTVPILFVLIARLVLYREASGQERTPGLVVSLCASVLLFVAMVVSEYVMVFAASLLCAEFLARFASSSSSDSVREALFAAIKKTPWTDALVFAGVVAVYAGYRWLHPSTYDGNSLDGIGQPWRVVVTGLAHVAAGTVLPRLGPELIKAPAWVLAAAIPYGLVFYCMARKMAAAFPRMASPTAVLVAGALLSLLVVLPLAVTSKQQMWCIEGGVCGYLDSRIAYLWLGVSLSGVAALIGLWAEKRLSRQAWTRVFGAAIGMIAGAGFVHNWGVSEEMREASLAWERAEAIACYRDGLQLDDGKLGPAIDPHRKVALHPHVDSVEYWGRYVAWREAAAPCYGSDSDRREALSELIKDPRGPMDMLEPGQMVRFSRGAGEKYLYGEWSEERWGYWSTAKRASVRVRFWRGAQDVDIEVEMLRYIPPGGGAPVQVLANGQEVARLTITEEAETYRLRIPSALVANSPGGVTNIEFVVADASSPIADGRNRDPRILGVGLVKMTFVPVSRRAQ